MFLLIGACFTLGVLEGTEAATSGLVDRAEAVADTPDRAERSRIAEDHTDLCIRSFSALTLRIRS